MANDDTRRELESLRAQVAELGARRAKAFAAEAEGAAEAVASAGGELKEGLEELGDLLETELRNHPTATALAVFALGVLVGRALR